MIKFNVNGLGEVKVYASFKGETKTSMFNQRHYKFQILIETSKGKAYFTFHDSYFNYTLQRRTLNKDGIITALDCLLSDIYDYINDEIKDLYDDPDEASRIEKACKKQYLSFQRIVGDSSIDEFNEAFEKFQGKD